MDLTRRSLLCGAVALAAARAWGAEALAVPPGRGRFVFRGWAGPAITVESWLPSRFSADAPVVIVMHGVGRNADHYCDAWGDAAAAGAVVLAPCFDKTAFPGSAGYAQGFVRDAAGRAVPRERWTFTAVEALFDAVRAALGLWARDYVLFGHSAGAQFVHRLVWFLPRARYSLAIAANAGWYTLPDETLAWPYGLAGMAEADVRRGLSRNVLLLLGGADIDPQARSLRKSPQAEAQGATRLERGHAMLAAVRAAAARQGVPCGWRAEEAPGIGHDGAAMSRAAWARLAPRLGS
ncbi:MAG: alpha/beta hydrolase [Rhodospirillaceae bacterium]